MKILVMLLLAFSSVCVNALACELRFDSGVRLPAELALSATEQLKGLSGRQVGAPHSMLFLWPDARARVFWMKDTAVDLEVGFFDDELRLFAVVPMLANTRTYHHSPAPAKAALELPAGTWAQLGLRSGARLILDGCLAD